MTLFPPTPDTLAYFNSNAADQPLTRSDFVLKLAQQLIATQTAIAAGSVTQDHIVLANYWSVGATPATAGAGRLSSGGAINSRDAADAANVQLLALATFLDGLTTYDLHALFGGRLVYDPDDSQVIAVLNRQVKVTATDVYDPVTIFSERGVLIGIDDVTAIGSTNGTAGIRTAADSGTLDATSADGTHAATFVASDASLLATLKNLPTVDPAIAGRLFTSNAGNLAANLAAGALYVLVSDGP